MKDIRLTIVQCKSIAGGFSENLDVMERLVSSNSGSDIICFPEMCLSGYSSTDATRFALDPESEYVEEVHSLSKRHDVSIVFGYLEQNGSKPFMRQEIVQPSGRIDFYRKTHLGAAESKAFTEGDELPVFDICGVCVGIQLCIESHIPDITQTYRAKGAELVLMPFANGISGEKRKAVWGSYMPARASDNGIYVAACSSVGDNGMGAVFGGGLLVLDPKGNPVSEYYGIDEHSVTVEIGGLLPRDGPGTMSNISYYDRRRPELYTR